MKSFGEYRSCTLYHFVNGTLPSLVGAANNPTLDAVAAATYEAGDGSAAPAKSAKSGLENGIVSGELQKMGIASWY